MRTSRPVCRGCVPAAPRSPGRTRCVYGVPAPAPGCGHPDTGARSPTGRLHGARNMPSDRLLNPPGERFMSTAQLVAGIAQVDRTVERRRVVLPLQAEPALDRRIASTIFCSSASSGRPLAVTQAGNSGVGHDGLTSARPCQRVRAGRWDRQCTAGQRWFRRAHRARHRICRPKKTGTQGARESSHDWTARPGELGRHNLQSAARFGSVSGRPGVASRAERPYICRRIPVVRRVQTSRSPPELHAAR